MFIGSKSTDSILDIFRIGISELIRQSGLAEEASVSTRGCEMQVKGANLSKRVDWLQIVFDVKPGISLEEIADSTKSFGFAVHLAMENGKCSLRLPPFEWRQLPQLLPVDACVEKYAAITTRSQSWFVKVIKFTDQGFNINLMIEELRAKKGSDLHLRAGTPPYIRIDNDLVPLDLPPISSEDMEQITIQLGSQSELDKLIADRESSFQYHSAGIGYLRVSGYFKMNAIGLAIRLIPEDPVPFEQLNIPMVVRNIADARRGLFLVCGITGSGKSTTLASMVDYVNTKRHAHIITVEDPIEFVYRDKKSIVSQRQVGRDTFSFGNALRGALREDPDIILVGEMRDMDTIRAGVSAAETGHLVFSTLHTMTAVDTVNRVISYFPQEERDLIRQELAYSLKGVVCQRLLKKKGGGRIPCVEILLGGTPIVRDAIIDGEIDKLHSIIEVDSEMKTFDQHAVELYQGGIVTKEEAISACSNEEGFERIISGIKSSEGRKILK
jgi:twitching motility protein PilT